MDQVERLVEQAIRAATPPDQIVERKISPDSQLSWPEPAPAAGLTAALAVEEIARRQAYKFVLGLRAAGTSWREAADLLNIPWSGDYSRPERAYELVLGPEDRTGYRERNLYWHCGGPLGCGEFITDRGPYNGRPSGCEDGHAEGCRRLAAEVDAFEREWDERERREKVAEEALARIDADDDFAQATVSRARWVLTHGGQYQGWSTSETLAVALVLKDEAALASQGYSTRARAVERVFGGMNEPSVGRRLWLATVRAAATGETD